MDYIEYQDPWTFLTATESVLEDNEVLHGLMFGISLRLVEDPLYYGSKPLLAAVLDKGRLKLIALMTPPHKLQIASLNNKSDQAIEVLAAKLHERSWHVPAVIAEEKIAKQFESEWNMLTGGQSEHGMRQRIYELRAVEHHDYPSGNFRQAGMEDLNCAVKWTGSFQCECFGRSVSDECTKAATSMIENGDLYFWEDPLPVSMAAFSRPTKNGVSISYVYTPPIFRGKGYATAVVASLSKLALMSGKEFCTLYTDLSNPTSNNIYQNIGYGVVADVMDVNFANKDKLPDK